MKKLLITYTNILPSIIELTTKRRRFHPLRNLRRIFRRRTINTAASVDDHTANSSIVGIGSCNTLPPKPSSSSSEKNLRSATLSSINTLATASSPSSPLTHAQLHESYSRSLPKSASYSATAASAAATTEASIVGKKESKRYAFLGVGKSNQKKKEKERKEREQREQQEQQEAAAAANSVTESLIDNLLTSSASKDKEADMYTASSTTVNNIIYHNPLVHHQPQGLLLNGKHQGIQRQSLGVAVLPSAMTREFLSERLKLRSMGDSSQDLDSSCQDSGGSGGSGSNTDRHAAGGNNSEMSDSQRSLSEGRLIDR